MMCALFSLVFPPTAALGLLLGVGSHSTPVSIVKALGGRKIKFLAYSVLLAVCLIYIYTVFAFTFRGADSYNLDAPVQWNSLGSALFSHLDYGFRNPPTWEESQNYLKILDTANLLKFLFSFSYNLVIIGMFGGIITGVVIDTFGDVRQKQDSIAEDDDKNCFICGLSSDTFDQMKPDGFRKHCHNEHYLWDYIHYFESIIDVQHTDDTPLDKHVKKNYPARPLLYMPVLRSLQIDDADSD
eukprot:NODE_1530_length_1136_cov_132.588776_g1245_i0.p1 GENE.NODE_1530_length_1136_cov_132.588776_g1245_i0~~NODE_1530_length_1136_cov_132.588776_g1245_i0.p1  ORF type:complete len:241 (+),score=57.59 NODE_1530_length_1136_cov_132.588776_g1245_i0:303-1025(+)